MWAAGVGVCSATMFLFQLILGIPEQALSLLHMAIEPILADGAVLDKGRAMFLVAKCQVASAASYDRSRVDISADISEPPPGICVNGPSVTPAPSYQSPALSCPAEAPGVMIQRRGILTVLFLNARPTESENTIKQLVLYILNLGWFVMQQ